MGIGTQLKEARETKGLTLDELQESTKIQKRYLQAIEEENFDILPGTFYARAFIKEYASAVGLDEKELLEAYEGDIPKQEETETPQYTNVQRSRKTSSTEKSSAIFSIIPRIIVVLLVIGVLFAGWYFVKENWADDPSENNIEEPGDNQVYREDGNNNDSDNSEAPSENNTDAKDNSNDQQANNDNETQDNDAADSDSESSSQPDPELELVETDASGGQATSEFNLNHPDDSVALEVETTGRTWLTVESLDEEKLYYDFIDVDNSPLERDIDISQTDGVYLKIGHAPDVSITINGIELNYPDDPNKYDVQSLTINFNQETD